MLQREQIVRYLYRYTWVAVGDICVSGSAGNEHTIARKQQTFSLHNHVILREGAVRGGDKMSSSSETGLPVSHSKPSHLSGSSSTQLPVCVYLSASLSPYIRLETTLLSVSVYQHARSLHPNYATWISIKSAVGHDKTVLPLHERFAMPCKRVKWNRSINWMTWLR
jgi:hypothetical protein